MEKIIVSSEYFCVEDTLSCGQIFRYKQSGEGYIVFSLDKACYLYEQDDSTIILCEDEDKDYFYNFFDLDRDYKTICDFALNDEFSVVKKSASLGKGIRILNQNILETTFSFIVSQNNNITRIKGILERLCSSLGEKKSFMGQEYYAFPTAEKMAKESEEFYKRIGLGYRAGYIKNTAVSVINGLNLAQLSYLNTKELKKELVKIKGIGAKVADCISLFGYHRADSFPVDTWIEKVYKEDFFGTLTDRDKITDFFIERYGEYSGYIQQYLFYYKRSLEKKNK